MPQATKPRKAPLQARSKMSVEAILEAAARFLEEGDYFQLTTNRIAERAGVGIATLYQYFPSKEAIVAELLRRERQVLLDELAERARASDGQPLAIAIDLWVEAALDHQFRRPKLARALEIAELYLEVADETQATLDAVDDVVADRLQRVGIAHPQRTASELAALTRSLGNAASQRGDFDRMALKRRILAAIRGYLAEVGVP